MSNEKGAIVPPRPRPTPPSQSASMTEEQRAIAQQEVINKAPLRSTDIESTNQAVEPIEDVKPWRSGMQLPAEALMQIRKKTSMTMAMEHELRLAYILNDKNSKRGFGPKFFINDLINEAIEQYTKAELKKLGFDTK